MNASNAISILPTSTTWMLLEDIPLYIAVPSPPAPINDAIPAKDIVITTMLRKPVKITGSARGNFILVRS